MDQSEGVKVSIVIVMTGNAPDWHGKDLSGKDLHGEDLSGANLMDANLTRAVGLD